MPRFVVGLPEIAETFRSTDGTERYLVACGDKQTVETVWMPGGDGGEEGDGSEDAGNLRATICVSSQIGCAVNCQFCLTARLGLLRNLTAGEIAGQVVAVLKRQKCAHRPRPYQPCFHGDGGALPELRRLHGRGPSAGE